MMRRNRESPDCQARIGLEFLARTSLHVALHHGSEFLTNEIPQPFVLLNDEKVIRALRKQPFAHALAELLERVSILAREGDGSVNKVVQRQTFDLAVPRKDDQPAASAALEPLALHEVLIGLAYRVVMHFKPSSEFPDAGQLFPVPQPLCRNEKNDLLGELATDRDLVRTVNVNVQSTIPA
jgi:hypothetical protein